MKITLCLLFSLMSFSSFAATKKLLSADTCMRAMIACPQVVGVDFLSDQDGRCGCVKKKDYMPMKTCIAAFIVCDEKKGATLSYLTNTRGEQVGCGCFATSKN